MTENSFVKEQSDNLPKIDVFMMITYFAFNLDFTSAELRGVKAASDDLRSKIMDDSTSRRKRFSLRLSSQLLRGLVKLYNEKVTSLSAELYTVNSENSKQINDRREPRDTSNIQNVLSPIKAMDKSTPEVPQDESEEEEEDGSGEETAERILLERDRSIEEMLAGLSTITMRSAPDLDESLDRRSLVVQTDSPSKHDDYTMNSISMTQELVSDDLEKETPGSPEIPAPSPEIIINEKEAIRKPPKRILAQNLSPDEMGIQILEESLLKRHCAKELVKDKKTEDSDACLWPPVQDKDVELGCKHHRSRNMALELIVEEDEPSLTETPLPRDVAEGLARSRTLTIEKNPSARKRRSCGHASLSPRQKRQKENVEKDSYNKSGIESQTETLDSRTARTRQRASTEEEGPEGPNDAAQRTRSTSETPLGSLDRTKVSVGNSVTTTDSNKFISDEWGLYGTMVKILRAIKERKDKECITLHSLIAAGPTIPGRQRFAAAMCFSSMLKLNQHEFIRIETEKDSTEIADVHLGTKIY